MLRLIYLLRKYVSKCLPGAGILAAALLILAAAQLICCTFAYILALRANISANLRSAALIFVLRTNLASHSFLR